MDERLISDGVKLDVLSKGAPPMPPGQSKVELYAGLRRDSRDGMSNRALQCKYGVTWSTVNKA